MFYQIYDRKIFGNIMFKKNFYFKEKDLKTEHKIK